MIGCKNCYQLRCAQPFLSESRNISKKTAGIRVKAVRNATNLVAVGTAVTWHSLALATQARPLQPISLAAPPESLTPISKVATSADTTTVGEAQKIECFRLA